MYLSALNRRLFSQKLTFSAEMDANISKCLNFAMHEPVSAPLDILDDMSFTCRLY